MNCTPAPVKSVCGAIIALTVCVCAMAPCDGGMPSTAVSDCESSCAAVFQTACLPSKPLRSV